MGVFLFPGLCYTSDVLIHMRMKTLKCRDFGLDCNAEFRGETVEAVIEQAKAHGMEAHGQKKADLESEQFMAMAASKVREE